jgi:hypothetical protein
VSFTLGEFASQQQQWSEKTFGPNDVRGAKGPLMHLELEVQEAIKAIGTPELLEELADCLFLIVDATWRSGYWTSDLLSAAMAKLDKNKSREWGDWKQKDPNAPIEHKR